MISLPKQHGLSTKLRSTAQRLAHARRVRSLFFEAQMKGILKPRFLSTSCVAILFYVVMIAQAQTTALTYQGKLNDGGDVANGTYDMQFNLFDTPTVGTGVRQGPTITNAAVTVTNGIFAVVLDFGLGAFSGPPRYLEIGVRTTGSPNPYTVLSPRQQVQSAPYSVRSLNSSVADVLSAGCVGC